MNYSVSIIIPCYDEEKTIIRKLENCLSLDVKFTREIIVVDDNSNDNTIKLAQAYKKKHHNSDIILLKNRYLKGKAGAVQTALEKASGDLVLMTDADILLKKGCLKQVNKYFKDKTVGAICFSPRVTSTNINVSRKFIASYERFNRFVKIIQSKIDSLVIMHGQALVFRRSLGIQPDPSTRADDVDFANQIRKEGFKCKYADDIYFYEDFESNIESIKKQKYRRCNAVVNALRKHRYFLFNPKYGLYGLICFPIDWFLYFVVPWLVLISLFVPLVLALTTQYYILLLLWLIALFLLSLTPVMRSFFTLNMMCLKCIINSTKKGSRWQTKRN